MPDARPPTADEGRVPQRAGEPSPASHPGFLAGGGEMGALMRAHNWAATPLGPPETWPQALKTIVRLVLTSRHPMFVWWGEALTCLYNDAYSALIGPDRHPAALGCPGQEVWAEIWDVIGPQIDIVMAGRGATWHERQLIPITRGDRREDVWWTYGYSPIDDEVSATGVGGVLVVCRDVTAEVRAEQAHAEEAERLRGFFEQAPGFMALLRGPDQVFELANAAYLRLVGRDVLGKTVRDALPEVAGQGFFELLDRVCATGEALTARHAPITLAFGVDGALERRFLDFVFQPIRDAAGAVSGIFVEGSDVTEATLAEEALRASEARQAFLLALGDRLRDLADPREIMHAAAGLLGRHLGADRAGYAEIEDAGEFFAVERDWCAPGMASLAGRHRLDDFGPALIAQFRAGRTIAFEDALADPLTPGEAAAAAYRGASTRAAITVPLVKAGRFAAALYVHGREPRRWTGEDEALVREVAERTWAAVERARAEAALLALNATLEQRVEERTAELQTAEESLRQAQKMEAVGQLTGGIAHDFNNLLQIVTGNLDILCRNLPEDAGRLRRSAENAMTGAQRAAVLTQRLLAFSRRQPLAPKPINVNALVSGMSELLGRTLGETIQIETVQAGGLWRVEADPNQLESAILNLAVNARDAMPTGGKLTIETANAHLDRGYAAGNAEVTPGQYVVLCVSDTGAGMDKDTMARVFEPFFTTKEVGKGTGLGLSQVYGFVKQSGGNVTLYSERGQGTTVKIYLPRLLGAGAEEDTANEQPVPEGMSAETVLVVEDDDDVRALSVEVLRELGYRVLEAHDASSALRLLERQEGRVDLLFTDVVLPGAMTGAELAAQARALRPALKVLYTTGYARNAIVHQGRLNAGVALITKPFSYADLAARVREILDASSGIGAGA